MHRAIVKARLCACPFLLEFTATSVVVQQTIVEWVQSAALIINIVSDTKGLRAPL